MPGTSSDRLARVPGHVIRQTAPLADDLERSVELLRLVAAGDGPERLLRLYAPAPTLALTRRESRMPGYDLAVAAAHRLGFGPAIRPTGGRAVAYDETCLVFDLVDRDDAHPGPSAFFARAGNTIADALRGLGVDARLGEVPGEYCPGEYSINARGSVKLIGTSQRGVRGARLLSGMIAFGPVDRFVAVLTEANAALGLDWDPRTFGTMLVEAPTVSRADVEDALTSALLG
ncbi:lipoate--protein ligase family protein [Microbacterium sp. ASV81]|uniref:Lipoate--protein ligase family protein n=1 Tax=Microbacterium capsulatum TaxID=3041921 RepID=A0ABU0XEY5_9MICO|nr:lipoate--protein ligase family protein [Microbacterium sp. ASV81]MDQ4213487.1 lipoate--protein ligase family protein [Microbacterium sp. ASV81]